MSPIEVETGRKTLVSAVDFDFLAVQTFGDRVLEREILALFLAQARRLLPRLADMTPREQSEAAHLLRGACQGIGASHAAAALQAYEDADQLGRTALHAGMVARFSEVEVAILAYEAAP